MNTAKNIIKKDEKTVFALRALYEQYGYTQYKMSKFEEYDLYVRNKDFLVSDHIITFTDTDGKLMALKPDVTLSIVKNGTDRESGLQKVYYNENVYRIPDGGASFREIMQAGLECIGNIDSYAKYEVLLLAAKSLESISPDFVLDISHMGIISEVMDRLGIPASRRKEILKCLGDKNTHDLADIEGGEILAKLVSTYGGSDTLLPVLGEIYPDGLSAAAAELIDVVSALETAGLYGRVRIDFSVLNDMSYYSGIAFNGFINGIPSSLLSGGEYDHLMKKMGRRSGAIGFAVYLGMLEQYEAAARGYGIDTVILYEAGTPLSAISSLADRSIAEGASVLALAALPEGLKYRKLIKINDKGETIVENNA